jgi:ATP-binding cassette subfamily B protein
VIELGSFGLGRAYVMAWRLFRGRRLPIAGAALLSIAATQIALYHAQVLVHAVALLAGGNNALTGGALSLLLPDTLTGTVALYGVLTFCVIGLSFLDRYATMAIDAHSVAALQTRLHEQLLQLGTGYHAGHGTGSLQMLMTRLASQTAQILRDLLVFPLVRGIAIVTAAAYLWHNLVAIVGSGGRSAEMVTIIALALVGVPFLAGRLSVVVRTAMQASQAAAGVTGDELVNSLRRPVDLQVLGAAGARQASYARRIRNALSVNLGALRRSQAALEIQSGVPALLQAGVLVWAVAELAGMDPAKQALAGAAIVGLLQFLPMMLTPIQQIVASYNQLVAATPAIVEVANTLAAPREVPEVTDASPLRIDQAIVQVEDLEVRSLDGAPVLRSVTHQFDGGRCWGLVGQSGSGKSTLLGAIARAFDPGRGRVLIDGRDLRTVTLGSLRQAVCVLAQFPPFIDDTVRANLNLAPTEKPDDELVEACRLVGVLPRLESLASAGRSPLDLPMFAESNKGALSGGERRLLALARVLAHRGSIVLLDEPTAGVDAATKSLIARVIREELRDATLIVADHDMDFIAEIADHVVGMRKGTVVDSVPRGRLFEEISVFRELWEAQRRVRGDGMSVTAFPLPTQ